MKPCLTLLDHLDRLTVLHPTLCPRQVLGVRMALLACHLLDVDPVLERKSLFVYMEIGRCVADAVIIVTTASPTNGLMQLVDYGKVAATFVHLQTNKAVHISERHDSRETAICMMPNALSSWEAQRDAYQIMAADQLFRWQWVHLNKPLPSIPQKHAVICERCQDKIHEHQEVCIEGSILCKPCAFGSYFVPLAEPL